MLITAIEKRKNRNSYQIKHNNKGNRPILNVYKSNKNIYAQIVDLEGKILATFSSQSKEIADKLAKKSGIEIATEIGKGIAKKAMEINVNAVAFNKGPYIYIGRIKALADAAREAGLNF